MHALLKPLSVRLLAVPFSPFEEKSRVFSPDVCRNDPLENSSLVNAWNYCFVVSLIYSITRLQRLHTPIR